MSLPRYREYLPTGNPLIPKLPAEWSVSALRTLGQFLKGRGGSKQDASETGIPCIRYGELYTTFSYSIRSPGGFVPAEIAGEYEPISKGDVLFAASGEDMADIGRSAVNLLEGPTVCGGDLVILRPTIDVLPDFLGFACDSAIAKAQKAMMGRGTTVKHIYPDELRQVVIALPPRRQQEGIVRFLEKETAKIDALIAEQERLIALLQEKRQAVISHAVTKGLDPTAKMKTSGVDSIGAVPEAWRVLALRHILAAPITDGPHLTPQFLDEGVPFLSVDAIQDGELRFENCRFVSPSDYAEFARKASPRRGDILFGKAASTGKIARVKDSRLFSIWSPLALLRPDSRVVLPAFLEHYLKSASTQAQIDRLCTMNTQRNISMGDIGRIAVALPPLPVQEEILQLVESNAATSQSAVDATRNAVALLFERRTALITAAVTGQIDVRGLVETAA